MNSNIKLVVNEPPIVQTFYKIENLESTFNQINKEENFALGSRNFISRWTEYGQGQEIQELYKYFNSIKKDIILSLLNSGDHIRYHKNDWDRLVDRLHFSMFPLIDKKGYNLGWHIDHRLLFANGILNIIDNESNTKFSKEQGGKEIHAVNGDKNVATFWLTTENNWHCVNEITRDRFIVAFSLSFYEL